MDIDLVDTHCHIQSIGSKHGERLTLEKWNSEKGLTPEIVIEEARELGVNKLICVGCDVDDSVLAVNFAQQYDNCFSSIGIHPHEASKYVNNKAELDRFTGLASEKKVVAIGECGLDYFYNHSKKQDQIKILEFQLDLALRYNLPVIFHVREALEDFWPIIGNFQGIRGVLHSFTDSIKNLEIALSKGLFIGVNGIITFNKDEIQAEMFKSIPLESMLLETDSPYLTPTPYRGTINVPKRVRTVAQFVSEQKHQEISLVANKTTKNANKLFGI